MTDAANRESTSTKSIVSARTTELLLPRLLASLISLTLVGLGVTTVVTRHYYGATSKLGGAEVSLDGPPATAIGVSLALLGLVPLAFWFRSKRPAAVWAGACLIAAGAAFYVSIHLGRA
jgi:uncharacterized membrane protein YczE